MYILKNDLLTETNKQVLFGSQFQFNAPGTFMVVPLGEAPDDPFFNMVTQGIHFQEGSIQEHGVNGVTDEEVIAMVICRLEHFNQSDYRCKENSMAITKLEEALLWLTKRKIGREKKKIEETLLK